MSEDEKAIREVVSTWMSASRSGDLETMLGLMSDDVVFMVAGMEPFGKEAFAASSKGMKGMQVDGTNEIVELKILGDWAWIRNKLDISITPPNGTTVVRRGYTLTILQKNDKGKWVVTRDANLLTAAK
jgi:uncharacterized protein (TIGR02246 family)